MYTIVLGGIPLEQKEQEGDLRIESSFWRGLFLLLVLIAVVLIGYQVRSVLNPLLIGLGFAYILHPVVRTMENNTGLPRTVAVSVLFVVFFGGLLGSMILILPMLQTQSTLLYQQTFSGDHYVDHNGNGTFEPGTDVLEQDLDRDGKYDPSYLSSFTGWVTKKFRHLQNRYPKMIMLPDDFQEKIREGIQNNLQSIGQSFTQVGTGFADVLGAGFSALSMMLSYLVLLPLYTFFFLLEMNSMWEGIVSYFPEERKRSLQHMFGRINRSIRQFFRGQLLICLVKGVLIGGGLTVFGIPYSIILGILGFVGSFVPFLVNVLSFLPALGIVLFNFGLQWPMLISVVGTYVAVEILEGSVLQPFIMGKQTGAHPLTIVVSLLIGGNLLGIFGMLLAVPTAMVVKIVGEEVIQPNIDSQVENGNETKETLMERSGKKERQDGNDRGDQGDTQENKQEDEDSSGKQSRSAQTDEGDDLNSA